MDYRVFTTELAGRPLSIEFGVVKAPPVELDDQATAIKIVEAVSPRAHLPLWLG